MIGLYASSLVAPSSRDQAQHIVGRRLQGEETPPVEYELLRRDGTTFYGEMMTTILRSPHGTPSGYICNTRDTTVRRQAEAAVRESEERYRDLFERAVEGIYQISLEGAELMANPAMARMLGYASAADFVSQVTDVAQQVWVDPDERPRLIQLLAQDGPVRGYECQLRRKDGRRIWVSVNARVVPGPAGAAPRCEGVVTDITERKLAEEALRAGELRLQLNLEGAVTALGVTTELRDPYTSGHQRRVAELACAIAGRLGCGQDRIELLRTAARLHDVGKVVVPAEILAKPGRLSEPEVRLIRQHPAAGAEIVGHIGFDADVVHMIHQHHERLDGSGYPDGRRGTEILLETCILAVADVVEAMISHRPYRPALSIEAVVTELEDGAGRRYEPAVCEAAIALLGSPGFVLGPPSPPSGPKPG
jgi:PAS domain S-box-containing protein/putative nucleotidyltransferase with HDIG domain